MITLIALVIFTVIAIALLIVWLYPPAPPRRYTGKIKKLG